MAPRAAPALRVLPLALAAAIFSGLTAILVYLSGVSSSRNAPTPLPPLLVFQFAYRAGDP
jgi:hypothetical protein